MAKPKWKAFPHVAAGLAAGGAGITAANKAQAIYANSVEPREETRIALFEEVMKRAEAHVAMGAWHAEIIDKVGALVGGLTHGAKKDAAEEHFRKALELAPDSPIACIEMANGLVMIHGKSRVDEAGRLYARAAAMKPRDAMEALDVEAARDEMS